MTLTKASHGLTAGAAITATGATYDANTGIMVVTSNGHGLNNGDKVKMEDGAVTMTCDMDANKSEHAYPRAEDLHQRNGLKLITSKQIHLKYSLVRNL